MAVVTYRGSIEVSLVNAVQLHSKRQIRLSAVEQASIIRCSYVGTVLCSISYIQSMTYIQFNVLYPKPRIDNHSPAPVIARGLALDAGLDLPALDSSQTCR